MRIYILSMGCIKRYHSVRYAEGQPETIEYSRNSCFFFQGIDEDHNQKLRKFR